MPDSADWLHRLRIVGIDLRDPAQVVALADSVAEAGPLDILINNAAQTVRRSPGAYAPLVAAESDPLPGRAAAGAGDLRPHLRRAPARAGRLAVRAPAAAPARRVRRRGARRLALIAGSASPERIAAGRAIDAGGLVPDLHRDQQLDAAGGRGRPARAARGAAVQHDGAVHPGQPAAGGDGGVSPARRKYIVNVSAMEGQFGRGYKGPGHPHTNMAKAALNMLTRTSAPGDARPTAS